MRIQHLKNHVRGFFIRHFSYGIFNMYFCVHTFMFVMEHSIIYLEMPWEQRPKKCATTHNSGAPPQAIVSAAGMYVFMLALVIEANKQIPPSKPHTNSICSFFIMITYYMWSNKGFAENLYTRWFA